MKHTNDSQTMGEGMRSGANSMEVAQIKKLSKSGSSAEEISAVLRVDLKCVTSFVNYFKGAYEKPKEDKPQEAATPKTVTKKKAAKED